MRVEGLPDSQAAIRTNVSDLMGRLDTGDVIKAKVLEITSSEVILRLFDGSVLKAAAGEELQAKAGQTLSLVVTSKSDGILYLETLKDPTQFIQIKPDILKSLLSSLNIKPDANNLELAAEFIKYGINPTTEQFEKASALKKGPSGISAETAVFLASKGIRTDNLDLELLSKLLDGEIKLGKQLKELDRLLENTVRPAEKAIIANTAANDVNADLNQSISKSSDTGKPQSGQILSSPETQSDQQASQSQTKNGLKSSDPIIQKTADDSQVNGGTASKSDNIHEKSANPLKTGNSAGFPDGNERVFKDQPAASFDKAAEKGPQNNLSLQEKSGTIVSTTDDPFDKAINKSGANNGDTARLLEKNSTGSTEPFSKLKDAVKDLFVRLDHSKTSDGADLSKAHKELDDKLDILKSSLQSPVVDRHPSGEGIAAAVSNIDDTAKLINQLNNNGVLYFQLPVNLAGTDTTAELYIMKRQQGRKKIDPRNSVMFVSLDTENLGRFESLIDVKDKNVTLNIRTEKQEINDYIKENIKYLYTGLSDSGFKLADIRYALIDSATAPVELERVLSKMNGSNRTKFDLRI